MPTLDQLKLSKNKLKNAHDNFISCLILAVSMSDKRNEEYFRNCQVIASNEEFTLVQPFEGEKTVSVSGDYYHFKLPEGNYFLSESWHVINFLKGAVRLLSTDSFEAATMYYKNNQHHIVGEITNENWYGYAWVVRNCLTHDQTFHFSPIHKQRLPATFERSTIDESMDGKEAGGGTFWIYEAYCLNLAMQGFFERKISEFNS